MEKRISFFVQEGERTSDGWVLRGSVGLGPVEAGDEFSWVFHEDVGNEELLTLRVASLDGARLKVTTSRDVDLRANDVLGGEVDR